MVNAPGKSRRNGRTLLEVVNMFRDEETARQWIAERRWPDGPRCPHCGTDNVQENIKHPTMTHRCRECIGKPMFTVKVGTVMEVSKIKRHHWAVGTRLSPEHQRHFLHEAPPRAWDELEGRMVHAPPASHRL